MQSIRYLQCEGLVLKSPKTKLQMIGVTAMFIAAKVNLVCLEKNTLSVQNET